MVSTMIITCTGCGKKIQGPTTLQGKKIRCKVCGTVFVVAASAAKKPAADAEEEIAAQLLDVMPVEEVAPARATDRSAPQRGSRPAARSADRVSAQARHAQTAAPQPAPPPTAAEDDEESGPARTPYGVTDVPLDPHCPHCANAMEEGEIICLHCGYNIETRERHKTIKTIEHTGLDWTLWLAPGILCVLADLLLIGCIVFLWLVFPRLKAEYDYEWWGDVFGFWAQLWGSVLCLFLMFLASRFAIRRLIFNPRPPEKFKG